MQQIDLREPENFIPMHKTAEEWFAELAESVTRFK